MAAFKSDNGTWYVSYRIRDLQGKRIQKVKRGFATKREALEFERESLLQNNSSLEMNFVSFVEIYINDMKNRIKENTWRTKESIINSKILPYFKDKKINAILPRDIIAWQNEIMKQNLSATTLKSIHNQISAIFNHAVRYYELKSNPAAKAGNMGKKESENEMLFWTKEEYLKFADSMMDKPISFYAFEMLYWCGVREGELLALMPKDFDFEKQTVSITKSYQRIKKRDVITDPKTPKSKRVIQMPDFLCEEMKEYIIHFMV